MTDHLSPTQIRDFTTRYTYGTWRRQEGWSPLPIVDAEDCHFVDAEGKRYLDFSAQSLLLSPATLAGTLREWLEHVPEKVMFATDAYPYSNEMGWEEGGWIAAHNGREALGRALTVMLRDGAISHTRAVELARMVLRDNARALYGF